MTPAVPKMNRKSQSVDENDLAGLSGVMPKPGRGSMKALCAESFQVHPPSTNRRQFSPPSSSEGRMQTSRTLPGRPSKAESGRTARSQPATSRYDGESSRSGVVNVVVRCNFGVFHFGVSGVLRILSKSEVRSISQIWRLSLKLAGVHRERRETDQNADPSRPC